MSPVGSTTIQAKPGDEGGWMTSPTDAIQAGAEQVRSNAGDAVDQAQDKVQQAAEQARQTAVEAKEQGKSLLRSQIEERSSQAGQQLHSTVQDLRTVGEQLRSQGKETSARIADQVAERGEQVAQYLRTTDGDRLLRDVEQFARRQPWAVIAGGITLGFVASRFLKSSSSQRFARGQNGPYVSTRSTEQLRQELGEDAPAPYGSVSGFSDSPVSQGL